MTKQLFIGKTNNTAKKPSKILVGNSSNIAKEVKSIFVGNSSNKAVRVYPNLPDIYQRCEYLYDTNYTEFIKTGIKPNSNTRVVIDAKKNNSTNSNYDRELFYVNHSDTYFSISWRHTSSETSAGHIYFNFGTNHTVDYRINYADWWNGRHTYDFNRSGGHFYCDTVHVGQSTNTFGTLSNEIYLWDYGSADDYYIARWYIYSCKIYQNGILVRDMWPCYRKSDYKPGMFDFVNDVFYTNAGSGEFYKGPDVN